MIKEEFINDLKRLAKSPEELFLWYNGEKVALLVVPKKEDDESMGDYLEKFVIESRANEYLLTIKLDNHYFGGYINILFDNYSTL